MADQKRDGVRTGDQVLYFAFSIIRLTVECRQQLHQALKFARQLQQLNPNDAQLANLIANQQTQHQAGEL